jgi:hypothetical protein
MKKIKIVKCLKCKSEFKTEIDLMGVPYRRICNACKKNPPSYGRGIVRSELN